MDTIIFLKFDLLRKKNFYPAYIWYQVCVNHSRHILRKVRKVLGLNSSTGLCHPPVHIIYTAAKAWGVGQKSHTFWLIKACESKSWTRFSSKCVYFRPITISLGWEPAGNDKKKQIFKTRLIKLFRKLTLCKTVSHIFVEIWETLLH